MKAAPFKYIAAESVEEAVEALAAYGDEAKVLAGGQSLVPLMNMRLAQPGVLVDVNRIAQLADIAFDGALEIGAVTRQIAAERSSDVAAAAPLLAEALHYVGHPTTRTRGTVGGTVAHADPAAEVPAVLVALEGEVVVLSRSGERTIAADDLFLGYFTTALAPDELLTRVRVPKRPKLRTAIGEVARKQGDFALVGTAVAAEMGGNGVCRSARIVLFGVADRPVRAAAAEQAVAGSRLDGQVLAEAERATQAELDPKGDAHASGDYRRQVAGVLVRRTLAEIANGGGGR